jgi:hypothetical protein
MRRKTVFKKGPLGTLAEVAGTALFTLAVVAVVAVGLAQTAESNRAEGLRLLEESIQRAVTQCYALEGRFPDSIGYIEEHYGVIVDRSRFAVNYNAFADNIRPDITVFDIREQP